MKKHLIAAVTAVSMLAACGGGGDSSTTTTSPSGYWTEPDFGMLVTNSGEIWGVDASSSTYGLLVGNLTTSGDKFTASLKVYRGGASASASASGSFVEKKTFSGTAVAGAESDAFKLTYDNAYEAVPSLSRIAGTYSVSSGGSLVVSAAGSISAATPFASALFLIALFGFGIKAGMMPFHVWLPSAHANAPCHVSSVMSGVILKIGIYGLLRTLSFFDAIPLWWGITVLALGVISGVLGVVFAIGQHDLKRLLAYHSIENIGIILMGAGVGLIGLSTGHPQLVVLGMAGALLHVLNHAVFKSLLFPFLKK